MSFAVSPEIYRWSRVSKYNSMLFAQLKLRLLFAQSDSTVCLSWETSIHQKTIFDTLFVISSSVIQQQNHDWWTNLIFTTTFQPITFGFVNSFLFNCAFCFYIMSMSHFLSLLIFPYDVCTAVKKWRIHSREKRLLCLFNDLRLLREVFFAGIVYKTNLRCLMID